MKMEEILNQSKITGFSMCHALMCEPNLPNLWMTDSKKQQSVGCVVSVLKMEKFAFSILIRYFFTNV